MKPSSKLIITLALVAGLGACVNEQQSAPESVKQELSARLVDVRESAARGDADGARTALAGLESRLGEHRQSGLIADEYFDSVSNAAKAVRAELLLVTTTTSSTTTTTTSLPPPVAAPVETGAQENELDENEGKKGKGKKDDD